MDVRFEATPDLNLVLRALRETGDKELRRELYAGLNRATKEVRGDMRASIPASLPSRGGLAALVHARASLTTSATTGRDPGVRIRARSRDYDLKRMNAGRLRHPVFGNRGVWVQQTEGVNPGFLDDPFKKAAPGVRREVEKVLNDIAAKIAARLS